MIFKDHKASIQQILRIIPDGLISKLAVSTKVNYCAKVLQGERLFNLLLYSILKTDRISQRFLEDLFKSSDFKALLNYSLEMKVTQSSISEKLFKVNPDFFSQAYECIYKEFSRLYSEAEKRETSFDPRRQFHGNGSWYSFKRRYACWTKQRECTL